MKLNSDLFFNFHSFFFLFTGPGDYTPVERTLIFTNSMQEYSIPVPLTDDDLFEDNEYFFASLVLQPTDLNVRLEMAQTQLIILDADGIG